MRRINISICLALLLFHLGILIQPLAAQSSKVACTPCEDYYGYGNYPPAADFGVIYTSTPGLVRLYHILDPDSGTSFANAEWGFEHDMSSVYSYPGDTISHQFPANDSFMVHLVANYGTNAGWCQHYNHFYIHITDFPELETEPVAAPEAVTHIEEVESAIFPNPSNGLLTVRIVEKLSPHALLYVMAMDGRVLHHQPWRPGVQTLDLTDLAAGMYMIRVDTQVWRVRKD